MSLDLQLLSRSSLETILTKDSAVSEDLLDLGSMNLCFRNDEEANIIDQLVIYDSSFGLASTEDKIKVKPIEENEIIEVNKQYIKVSTSAVLV